MREVDRRTEPGRQELVTPRGYVELVVGRVLLQGAAGFASPALSAKMASVNIRRIVVAPLSGRGSPARPASRHQHLFDRGRDRLEPRMLTTEQGQDHARTRREVSRAGRCR